MALFARSANKNYELSTFLPGQTHTHSLTHIRSPQSPHTRTPPLTWLMNHLAHTRPAKLLFSPFTWSKCSVFRWPLCFHNFLLFFAIFCGLSKIWLGHMGKQLSSCCECNYLNKYSWPCLLWHTFQRRPADGKQWKQMEKRQIRWKHNDSPRPVNWRFSQALN